MNSILRRLRLPARCAYVNFLAWTGCLWWAKRQLHKRGAVITLAFHRVLDDVAFTRTNSLPGILVRERTFRDLVAYVKRHFEPIRLDDAAPGISSQKTKVIFTFDDGWRDNYTVVFPIARAYGLPFTVFICPGVLGQLGPFWPERACCLLRALQPSAGRDRIAETIEKLKQLPANDRTRYLAGLQEQVLRRHAVTQPAMDDQLLSRFEILEMSKAGVSFGSHTHTHQILTRIPAELAETELRESKLAIEELLGHSCTSLAYPNGDWSDDIKCLAGNLGFRTAVTTNRGAWTPASDNLTIPRSYMCETSVTGLRGRFSPTMFEYVAFWRAWRATREFRSGLARAVRILHLGGSRKEAQASQG